ncbi:MAG TPA: hypothetical protein VFH21_04760 [Burkholderiales bacterium]|nr:hypothetical protein [Burkholderiales bacterium]
MIIKTASLALALIAAAVLAYGYWHAETHGTLYVSLIDLSERNRYQPVLHAELSFMDASGQVLAKAKSEAPYGTVYLSEPAQYSCREFEQQASFSQEARDGWNQCFQKQSRWLANRAPEIKSVIVKTGSCLLNLPVTISKYGDWWLWWVPLPHVGGTPYTNYSISIAIDVANCAPPAASRIRA